jgi:5-methylcytosine-specific restriction endonuclease McrA
MLKLQPQLTFYFLCFYLREKKYLKLQWGHIKPRCRKDETQTIKDLCLLCARCNNQIQTSRYLCQLKAELQSKLVNIDELIKSSK